MTDTSPTRFQSFEAATRPADGPPRLAALREEMEARGFDGFLVPRSDRFQGEYVAPRDERLAWLTGFTGSAGFCAALKDRAAVFVDGRYTLQVRDQTDADAFEPVAWPKTKLEDWLAEALPRGGTVAYDPWVHTMEEIARLEKALGPKQVSLRPTENLVDAIWDDQPDPPAAEARSWPEAHAGRSAAEKIALVSKPLAEAGEAAFVLTQPDSLAWLLNIRGGDIAHTPVMHGFAILHSDGGLDLFADEAKLDGIDLPAKVRVEPPEAFADALAALSGPVRLDPATTPEAIRAALAEAGVEVAKGDDPCKLPKAVKTPAELAATRGAHLRDGAAVARFLHWFDGAAPSGKLTEIDCVRALESFRAETGALKDVSFDTIAGAGPHGAIVHYRVTAETNAPVLPGQLFLIDSGAQYEDGTTDITRTLAVGPAGAEERAAFTRVLKGMVAISRLRFPKGLSGRDIDALARAPLWSAGQDFDHGTGHGVGVYLSVHEGPQRISRVSGVPLEPGMILSNEPGYYREGAFGIRIENLVAVNGAPAIPGADEGREFLSFETLTFAPIDRRLVDTALLDHGERAWIDGYHAEVAARIGPHLDGGAAEWLARATAPL
ncbi:M24 family metallopeptidase [Rhodobacterales bacterium HKCCE2091]|nr:M24 family metallopeptidase [Rhodobacterales bacterium HKCCE2091]